MVWILSRRLSKQARLQRARMRRSREARQFIQSAKGRGFETNDIARLIGVYSTTVRRWETGQRVPNEKHLQELRLIARGTPTATQIRRLQSSFVGR